VALRSDLRSDHWLASHQESGSVILNHAIAAAVHGPANGAARFDPACGNIISRMKNLPSDGFLDRKDPYLRMLCVNVFVRDQDKSLRFYVDQLGFAVVIDESYESGGRWVAVAPPDGNTVLALVAPTRKSEEYKLIGRSRHAVFVTEDVITKYDEWRKRGVRFHHPPQTTLWGGIFTRFDDLDGNSFALVGRDAFVREIEAERRAAVEKLEAERRTAQELEIAKRVQARLFPQTLPQLTTLEYAGICVPAREVGGDYYDFLNLGRDRFGLVIADISGKGIGAALLMANLQANLRSQSAIALDQPERFLHSVNQLFCENTTDSSYATLFFAEYDDRSRRLRYVNCGHYSPLLLRGDNTLERLDSTCTVLGLFQEWNCSMVECQLFAGDILALYTDGVTESFSDSGKEFGEQSLIDALRRNRERSSQALVTAIVDEVRGFSSREQHDDITLIAAKCRGE
jgi:serine phosphatase RsbU (regulator of sigma subunit)/predicted enzyme related to lactoylglutathione lyase